MANRRFIDFPIASTSGDTDIILIWQDGANKQTTKATFLSGLPENLEDLNDVVISGLTNGQILRYDSVTGKWENTDQGNLDLNDLNDVSIVSPSNGQVLVYNSSTSKWENSSGGFVPYTGAVTTVNLGAQTIQAGQFVKAGGTSSQFLKADGSIDSTAYGTGTVTSVGLTMPSAFNVANSPITSSGTLAVTGAGTVGQYIRGDGSLADFPQASGGGSSVSYYLNGSVNQGTIGGVAYKELSKVPILGAGTQFTINADGYIAQFLTDAGDPNLLEIPGGNWNFETYFSASSSGGTPTFYVELYKYDGTTFTLIASSSTSPEFIAFGTNLTPYFSSLAVPTTTLALTDRLAVRYYVNHSGRTITLHTENNTLCQIVTTFTTGLTSLNGLTAQVQNLAVGTSGTDFNIASATATHTFNLPTASATNRGALSSADWTTFNNKQNALGYVPVPETRTLTINGVTQDLSANRTFNVGTVTSVGLSSATSGVTIGSTPVTSSGTITLAIATASGSQQGLLSAADWTTFNNKQNALTNPVTGTGTTNRLAKFTGASTIGNSNISDGGITILNENPVAGQFAWQFNGNTTTGLSFGASVVAGTNSSDIAFRVLNAAASSNYFVVRGDGAATFSSSVTAGSFIRSGGTSSQYLMADGSVSTLTNPVTGTGTTNYLPKFTGTSTIGNSIIQEGGAGIFINGVDNFIPTNGGWFFNGSGNYASGIFASSISNNLNLRSPQKILFQIGFSTEAMTLSSSGNLLVGTTTDNGARLQVSGDARISNVLLAGGAANIDSSLAVQISTTGSGTQRWFGANKNGSYGLIVGYSETTGLSGVGAYIRQVTSDPLFFVVNNSTTALTLSSTGAATFSSSVTAQVNNISADGAGVVLQGYIDNTLRIAVRGSGYNSGARGGLLASTGDFSSSVTAQVNNISADGAGVVLQGYIDNTLRIAVRGSGYNSGARGGLLASTGDFSSSVTATELTLNKGASDTIGAGSYVYYSNVGGTRGAVHQLNAAFGLDTFTFDGSTWSRRMTVTNSGNVGIGTTSPDSRLHVGLANNNQLRINYLSTGDNYYDAVTHYFRNGGGASNVMMLTNGGNVLIGTTTDAGFKLDVNGTGVFRNTLALQSSGVNAVQLSWSGSNNGLLNLFNGGSLTTQILASGNSFFNGGNVGIGTSSPQSPIDVISPTNGYVSFGRNISVGQWTGIHFGYREDNTFYRKSAIVFERTGGAAQGNIHFLNNNAADTTSASLSDSRMRITSGGALLINGQTQGEGALQIFFNDAAGSPLNYGARIVAGRTNSSVSIGFGNPNGLVGSIQTSGSSTSYNTSSDYRLKTDLKDYNGLDLVNKIKTYDFAWKTDNTRSFGVIAHELQDVISYAVTGQKDGQIMQGVDYSKLVPIMVKAIQELKQEIDTLKN